MSLSEPMSEEWLKWLRGANEGISGLLERQGTELLDEIDLLRVEVERLKEQEQEDAQTVGEALDRCTALEKERDALRAALEKLWKEAFAILSEYAEHGDICNTNRSVLLDRIRIATDALRESGEGKP